LVQHTLALLCIAIRCFEVVLTDNVDRNPCESKIAIFETVVFAAVVRDVILVFGVEEDLVDGIETAYHANQQQHDLKQVERESGAHVDVNVLPQHVARFPPGSPDFEVA